MIIVAAVLLIWFLLSVVVALLLAAVMREGNRIGAAREPAPAYLPSTEVPASAAVPAQADRPYPLAS